MPTGDVFLNRQVGPYRIDQLLGEGGFAFVYRARDTNLEIDVAVKVLKPSFAYDEVFERNFRREAHLAAKFRHPNIIAIHFVGKQDEAVFFSMDLLEKGVAHLLRPGGPLETDIIVKVGSEVSGALAFAHKGGVVHRDLKPDNILFDRHGNAVVTDFGIADAITNYTEATGTTVYIGTPKYMSPEQARGQRVDHRSDVYSLGVTLYHMATGEAPFTGADWFELGRKHIAETPPPPRQRNPSIDAELERVILKCIAKEPAARYQSAEELRQDLTSVGRPSATVAYPTAPPTPAARPPARRVDVGPPRERRGGLRLLMLGVLAAGGYFAYDQNVAGARAKVRALWSRVQPREFYVRAWPAQSLDPTGVITLHLSRPANATTVSEQSVRLVDLLGQSVPVRVSVSPDARAIIVVPDRTLEFAKRYNLVVDSAVKDRSGNPIRAGPRRTQLGASLPFETLQEPPDARGPHVARLDPDPEAEIGTRPTFTLVFDEPVQLATVDASSIRLVDAAGAPVPARILVNAADARTVSVEPERPLAEGATYVLEVAGTVADALGNRVGAPQRFAYRAAGGGSIGATVSALRVQTDPINPEFALEIHVDGARVGEGPALTAPVRAGTHRVEVYGKVKESANKLKVYENDYRVAAGDTVPVRPTIQEFGALYVSTQPPSGRVYLNDVEVGTTPLIAFPVREGSYTLRIEPPAGAEARFGPILQEIVIERYQKRNLRTLEFSGR